MNKNDEIVLKITGYNSEAQGVGRYDGEVVFVPFALKGEEIRVTIIKVLKNYAVGKIKEIITPSPARIEPKCPYYRRCGGCSIQHCTYSEGLRIKQEIVKNAIERIGGLDAEVKEVIGCKNEYEYRNKSAFPLCIDKDGKVRVSMYRVLSHDPIIINSCPITENIMIIAANAFENYANKHFSAQKTQLRHIVMRFIDKKLLFILVTMKKLPLDGLFDELCLKTGLGKEDIGLFECVKKVDNNVILEGDLLHIAGIKAIESSRLSVEFEVSPKSFYQINDEIMQMIYNSAISEFGKDDIVVDAYSGAGLLSAMLAKKVKKVVGIEIVKDATSDANEVKAKNGIKNLENINGDVKEVLPKVVERFDKFSLIIDPPRKGVDSGVLGCIGAANPEKIVYISCNPASLARDLKILDQYGYKIEDIQPYDMFPQTQHIETKAVLKRK